MNLPSAYDSLRWIHFLGVAMAGGGLVSCLVISVQEKDRKGLAAILWSRLVAWGFRLGALAGLGLAFLLQRAGARPFAQTWLSVKLALVVVLFGLSESTPKALAAGKQGTARLVGLLFLLATFVTFNSGMFR